MKVDLIVLAIPVFLLLIALELVIARVQERQLYRLSDTLNDLSCGMISQLFEVLMKTVLFAGYLFLYERTRLAEIPSSAAWAWVGCFLGYDLLYYWFHRLSHEVNAFWAAHVVHHQSEEYNLAVALRQGTFQSAFSWVFYLPLAVIGFPPLLFLTVSSLDTLYQFWIHTRVIDRLGPLEWVLNTPSHHRVHHGRNPLYIDRNHAGTLIIWDRMFGTFQPEQEEAVFGITTPLRSWNPVWANLHYWVELVDKAKRTARFSDKVRMFLKPPGWNPEDLGGFQAAPPVDPASYLKWDSPRSKATGWYALVQFAFVLVATVVLLDLDARLARSLAAAGFLAVVASLVALGALLDGKAWAGRLEAGRLLLLAAAAVVLGGSGAVAWPVAGAALVVVALSLGVLASVVRSAPAAAPEATLAA